VTGVNLRELVPALEEVVYLDTPTAAPASIPVLRALRGAQEEWLQGRFSWRAWEHAADETRPLFAGLIGVDPSCVALLSSLSEAAATVAASLPPGQVVVGEGEFRSNLFPWLALERRGFVITEVPAQDGVVRTDALVHSISDGTVLVAVSEVQSSTGFRVHLDEVSRACQAVGARLFVNVTQSLGSLRFNAHAIRPDYVAAHGYKWLLAPRGAAWLYARPDRTTELRPLAPSWRSVPDPHETYYGGPYELSTDTRRLDTSLAWFPWVGARSALEVVSSVDVMEVEHRCLALSAAFRDEAESLGFKLAPQEAPSQVVSIKLSRPDAVKHQLAKRNVISAQRGGFLRLGFHAYNEERDVRAAVEALRESS
jgi:selenocysteine lyase/cysteine desulfurase